MLEQTQTASEVAIRALIGDGVPGLRIEVHDGTVFGPSDATCVVRITSPEFFHRLVVSRSIELALARSYVSGDLEIDGDIYQALRLRPRFEKARRGRTAAAAALVAEHGAEWVRHPLPPVPDEEIRLSGRLHTRRRDAAAISSHYDVPSEFYRLFLGPTMTYSCAVFNTVDHSLEQAQFEKHDLICRKLGLSGGMRLLDIGCGWGTMAIHAAQHYGVHVIGITISKEQAVQARQRVADAGCEDRVEIRLQDYRDIVDEPFDAVSSIGMFEHVGGDRMAEYFGEVRRVLRPGGRLLNHAINRPVPRRRGRVDPNGLIARYVFPDGELLEAGQIVSGMQAEGLEVRHLESFREHYGLTLREWVRRLDANWDEAVALTSPARARIWKLYMAACAVGFEQNEFGLTQILATNSVAGDSVMDLRNTWDRCSSA